jgi:DNA repair exonuclease SbcCD ATPase subunit
MNLKLLRIKNFLGIGECEVRFDRTGVTLIEGVNHDSPSSISNGAGKSSIFEALYWVLYGKTKRGLTGDDVINERAKKDCLVELEFDDYLIQRSRKDSTNGTSLQLYQMDGRPKGLGGWMDMTKGTVKDTQALIEEITKFSELTFSKVAYFGQGDIKGFAGLTDAELKKVFEQALGLTFFCDYLERAKQHRQGLEGEKNLKVSRLGNLGRELEHAQEKIAMCERTIEAHELRKKADLERLQTDLEGVTSERDDIKANAADEVKRVQAKIKDLEKKAAERKKLYDLGTQLDDKIADHHVRIAAVRTEFNLAAREGKRLADELANIEAKIGKPCGECGKTYELADLSDAKTAIETKLTGLRNRMEDLAATLAGKEEAVGKFRKLREQLSAKLADFDGVIGELAMAKTSLDFWTKAQTERLGELDKKEVEIKGRIEAKKADTTAAINDKNAAETSLVMIGADIETTGHVIERLGADIEVAKMLEEALGNGGLKSYVFDAITPELNKLIDRNIKMLDDIDIEVSTVTKLKSGEYREKFSIDVRNQHGAGQFAGNSGGEQQKVNLAISLAINTLIRTVSEGSINTIFLDECFENLDDGSSERVMELVSGIEVPNVFLITHRQGVKDLVPSVLTVEKKGGRATVH